MNTVIFPLSTKYLKDLAKAPSEAVSRNNPYFFLLQEIKWQDIHINELYDLQHALTYAKTEKEGLEIARKSSMKKAFAVCESVEACLTVLEWNIERVDFLYDRACCLLEIELNPNLVQEIKEQYHGFNLEEKYNLPTLDPSRM